MKIANVYHYDAFSNEAGKGNPAGVVLNGDDFTEKEMQEIAFKVGFNETSFKISSGVNDLGIRFFTPGHEMDLCGHATMATIYALKTKGLLKQTDQVTIKTRAGSLPIWIDSTGPERIQITMQQAPPQFDKFKGSLKELANTIGLQVDDIDDSLPILYGSTGVWTLLIPIKTLKDFKRMNPNNKLFPSVLKEMPKASIHPFCLETYDTNADMHARHFSSPHSGTIEDAVTGTASGVMGAYYAQFIKRSFQGTLDLIVEQGHEIGKDGRVLVRVSKNDEKYGVEITGNAVFVKELGAKLFCLE
ncbi:isomerase [Salipaludibacillus neizhouensis]|uniref:Isomerase n=1 Tax=Salipaludibacillus neizhouensis TaxID=885475 RepID=A0A3A9K3E6_9BACI|nr:PhzF family phenazine biosynthesis isomerase [Salipaludibacillus neizhouensis]RKL65788.1 isomerase [Salipaludibacillus neizhouensis]